MRNHSALATFLLVIAFSILVYYSFETDRQQVRQQYLTLIQSAGELELTGPDKASFRDWIMTMDPATGKVPRIIPRRAQGRILQESRNLGWKQVPSKEMAGRTRTLMIDPNDDRKLWMGAVTGGIWYNPDFRSNAPWVPVSDDWESLSIAALAHDPVNTSVFYAGTGESFTSVPIYRESSSSGVGIYKSEDAGATWQLLPSTTGFDYINDLVVREENGVGVIYAAVASGVYQGQLFASEPSDGLYRSADGGATWTQVLPNVPGKSYAYTVSDIEMTDQGRLYVGTMRNLESLGGGNVLSSSDGLTWEVDDTIGLSVISEPGVVPGRVVLKSGKDVLYAIGTGAIENSFRQYRDSPQFNVIYQKETGGAWIRIPDPFQLNSVLWSNIPWHALAMGVDPTNGRDLIIGALDMYGLQQPGPTATMLDWQKLTDWSVSYSIQGYLKSLVAPGTDVDSLKKRYVHADIHVIEFIKGTDELLMATDGGIYYSANISERKTSGEISKTLAFKDLNNGLNTMQFYTTALSPRSGNEEVMAGAQDNHTITTAPGMISIEGGIGYGDGAYCFFDADHPQLRITSGQANFYTIFLDRDIYFAPVPRVGTFINPATYDDRSNLLYTNAATDGGFEQLSESLIGRFLDTLVVLNVNKYLGTNDRGLDTISFVGLGTNSQAAFSALKVSPWQPSENATMVLGNQLGDVYRVSGLPNQPTAEKVDRDQLPVGYISSVDFGATSDHLLVTFSNYGVESVWVTIDGGQEWTNLDRNLPDIPVRHGLFNPNDHSKIVIATEQGVWGLEDRRNENAEWVSYNEQLPNVRVDMIETRKSDSVIVAATHGRGIFLGKLDQGDLILNSDAEPTVAKLLVYPNPTADVIHVRHHDLLGSFRLLDLQGKVVVQKLTITEQIDLRQVPKGIYIGQFFGQSGELVASRRLIKE